MKQNNKNSRSIKKNLYSDDKRTGTEKSKKQAYSAKKRISQNTTNTKKKRKKISVKNTSNASLKRAKNGEKSSNTTIPKKQIRSKGISPVTKNKTIPENVSKITVKDSFIKAAELALSEKHLMVPMPADLAMGSLLALIDKHGNLVSTAYYGRQKDKIGWVIGKHVNAMDTTFFAKKFSNAFYKRMSFLSSQKTTAFRVFNAEGDGIGGLIIDYYDGRFLVNYYNEGIYEHRAAITEAILKTAEPLAIIEKKRFGKNQDGIVVFQSKQGSYAKKPFNQNSNPKKSTHQNELPSQISEEKIAKNSHDFKNPTPENTSAENSLSKILEDKNQEFNTPEYHQNILKNSSDRFSTAKNEKNVENILTESAFTVRENDVLCHTDLIDGGMTGLFTDQREVRKYIRNNLSKNCSVLNLFSYTALFSVFAALGGASSTTNVDIARRSHDLAKRNFTLNHLSLENHQFITEDVFTYMIKMAKKGETYDLIIIDPPSFSTSNKGIFSSERDIKKLIDHAIKISHEDTVFLLSTNNSKIKRDKFYAMISQQLAPFKEFFLPEDYRIPHGSEGYLKVVFAKHK